MRRIVVLGSWWDIPKGDFPIRALSTRLSELRDCEIIDVDEYRVLAIKLESEGINYGLAVLVCSNNEAFMVLLKSEEDWQAVKNHVAEKSGSEKSKELIDILRDIAARSSEGIIILY